MPQARERLRLLLVNADDLTIANATGLVHPAIEFSSIPLERISISKTTIADRDAIIVAVDTLAALDLVGDLCRRENMPPVIALASRGARGRSLEHMLTLAELRGAALALPEPIDAAELALAAIKLVGRRWPEKRMSRVERDLERRLAG
jgi:hypothetical protein